MKLNSYAAHPQRSRWRENSLEGSDENETQKFNWHLTGRFRPYLVRYKGATLASVVLMLLYTAFSLANPNLIGVAIDQFIGHNDLHGLAIISITACSKHLDVAIPVLAGLEYVLGRAANTLPPQFRYVHTPAAPFSRFYDHTQIGRVMSRLQSDIICWS